MSNQYLKLRRSNVQGRIPTTESIDFGEIALNTYDGLAYMKKSGSNGIEVVPIGSPSGSFSGNFTGTFSGSFSGSGANLFGIPASGIVGLNLSQISSGSYSASISENGLLVNTRVVADSFTGSLFGTASWAENYNETDPIFTAVSGTFTTTSSFNAFTASYNTGSFTGSFVGSLEGTASWALNAITASYALNVPETASYALQALSSSYAETASYIENAQTASYVLNAISASYAETASFAPAYLPLTGGTINGNVTVNGTASVTFLHTTYVSSSIIYSSGSNQFGDATNDTQTLIGTVIVSGSQQITGSLHAPDITGSLYGTASWAVNAITASFVTSSNVFGPFGSNSILSASYAVSSSETVTASFASTASYLINAKEFYYTASAPSGSFITTGSLWIDSDSGYMFAYIDDGSDKVWIQPTVEGEQGPIGLTGPQGPVGPQGPTGSSQPFSFVGNDTWATTSSLQVTGSLTISGSSTFTNIGPAVFTGSVSITGSTTQTGNNTLIGNTTLSGSINVSGSQTFYGSSSFYGAHLLSGSNTIRGNTFMFGNIQVSGSSNFNNSEFIITGSTSILGNFNVQGTSVFSNTTFTVTGSQYFTGSSFINGNQSLTGNSTVTGSLNVIGDINVVSGSSFTRWGNKLFNYGIFSDTTTQTGPQNTILSMSFNTTDIGGAGVSVVDNTKITVDNTGIYNLQFSAQFDRTTSGTNTVTIWFAYTGSSIPNSATDVLISGNAANNPVVASWNYVLPMSASSYVEIYWSHDDNEADKVELKAIPARTGPVRPAVPSVIATLTQIA